MKKSLLFSTVLFFGINTAFSQDTIPNAGFEDWTGTGGGSMVNQPLGWGTANTIQIQLNNCATEATAPSDIQSGSSAILLTTVEVSYVFGGTTKTWRVAGTAVSGGQINQTQPYVTGGIEYTKRPTYLTGYCKYLPQQSTALNNGSPVGIDKSNIQVYLTRWDGLKTDTIGEGQLSPTNSTYAAFAVPIIYKPAFAGVSPDSAQIILASSKGIETAKNSKLYVDSLDFSFFVGIEKWYADKFAVKQNIPNPFTGSTSIQFNCGISEKISFSIFDMLGREVHSENINANIGTNTINYTSKLGAGTYFYTIGNDKYRTTKKMVIGE